MASNETNPTLETSACDVSMEELLSANISEPSPELCGSPIPQGWRIPIAILEQRQKRIEMNESLIARALCIYDVVDFLRRRCHYSELRNLVESAEAFKYAVSFALGYGDVDSKLRRYACSNRLHWGVGTEIYFCWGCDRAICEVRSMNGVPWSIISAVPLQTILT